MTEEEEEEQNVNGRDLAEILRNLGHEDDDDEEFSSFGEDLICTDYMDPTEFMESVGGKYDNGNYLNILHLNIDSLTTKFDAFRDLVGSELSNGRLFFDLIAISETHLRSEDGSSNSSSLSDDEIKFSLPNYCFIGKSRLNSKKGGCGFFYRKDLAEFVSIEEDLSIFEEGLFESVFLRLQSEKGDTTVGTIYLPTGQRVQRDRIYEHFETITNRINNKKLNCVIVGDMNIDLMRYGLDDKVGQYVDHFVASGFKYRLIQPTRVTHGSASLIDHVLDNMEGQTMTSGVITTQLYGSKGWTDHFPVYSIIRNHVPHSNIPTTRTRRRINQTTTSKFKEELAMVDFSSAHVQDQNDAMDKMMDLVMKTHDECFPLETVKVRRYNQHESRFMTSGLIKSCRTKDRMLKNITKNKVLKTSPSFVRFKKYRNLLTTLIRKQKKKHYNDEIEKHKNDIRKTLNLVKELMNKSNDKHSMTSTKFKEEGR